MTVANSQGELWRLRHCATLTPKPRHPINDAEIVSFLPMEAIGEDGAVCLDSEVSAGEAKSGYTYFEDQDIVIAKITPCFENGKGALVRNLKGGKGFGTTELHVLRPKPNLDARFLWWVTASPSFRDQGTATMLGAGGQKRVTPEFVLDYRIELPALQIQRKIADYLDRETAKIDALIDEKEQLLKLLDERRQAVITEAVTRGLVPNVPMKESGHPWLGLVPAHWQVERTRWLFKERDQRSETGEEELLTVSHITGVTPRSEKDVTMFLAESNEGYKVCHMNDLVINTMWAWMGAMGVSWGHGICSPSYNVYEPNLSLIDPEFLDCLSRMPTFVQEVTRHSKGVWSSRLRLYPEGLYQVWLALPPLEEQKAIVVGIRSGLKSMAKVVTETIHSIDVLKALRQSMIEEAVKGGIL